MGSHSVICLHPNRAGWYSIYRPRKDERLSWPRKAELAYSAIYMNQTRDQQRFTISEVASDWHEPMVPQRIMWPSTARANEQLDPRCS